MKCCELGSSVYYRKYRLRKQRKANLLKGSWLARIADPYNREDRLRKQRKASLLKGSWLARIADPYNREDRLRPLQGAGKSRWKDQQNVFKDRIHQYGGGNNNGTITQF